VIINPGWPRNKIRFRLEWVKKLHTILTQQHKVFIKKCLVDAANATSCSVVRDRSWSLRPFP